MSSQSNSGTRRPKVTLPKPVNEAIEGELDYGDHKSTWIKNACIKRLVDEGVLDEGDITEE